MTRAEEMSIGQVAGWFFATAEQWPDVFDRRDLGQLWTWACDHVVEQGSMSSEDSIRKLVQALRAGLLKRERAACNRCTGCDLHQNRLAGRPVFDDGDLDNDLFARWENNRSPIATTSAEIMIVGEGPGNFESRTGFPFVSYQGLAGASLCAYGCQNYSTCFNAKSKFPQGECQPVILRKVVKEREDVHPDDIESTLIQIRTERANAPVFPIQTAGNCLDKALFKAGLWREVWNARARLQGKEGRPGTVYVSNAVKCRACTGDKDRTPKTDEMAACRRWLELQLYIVQPKVIVALGNAAISTVVGLAEPKVLSRRGEIHNCAWAPVPVVLEVHPSYIIRQEDSARQQEYAGYLIESLELAKRIAADEVELPWEQEADSSQCSHAAETHIVIAATHPMKGSLIIQCPSDETVVTHGTNDASFLDEDEEDLEAEAIALKQEIIDELVCSDEEMIAPSAAQFIPTDPEDK